MWVFGTSQKTTTTTITKNKKKVHTAKSSIVINFCFCSLFFFSSFLSQTHVWIFTQPTTIYTFCCKFYSQENKHSK